MTRKRTSTRARLLGSVCSGVFAASLSSAAMAAGTEVDTLVPSAYGTSNATAQITSVIDNVNLITAAIQANIESLRIGTEDQSSSTTDANAIGALARGNVAFNDISLATIANDMNDGAAIAALSVNRAAVSSDVSDSAIATDSQGFVSGSVSADANTISALTFGNTGTTSLNGAIPLSYASTAAGSVDLTGPSASSSLAGGSLVATSVQTNTAGFHDANVEDNSITLDLTSLVPNTVTARPTLDDNTISATLRGNNAQTTVDVQSGGNVTFAGSAVVTTVQSNTGDGGVAYNSDSTIAAEVSSDNVGIVNELNGGLSVAGNTVSSNIVGNAAGEPGTTAIGNKIEIDTNVQGVQTIADTDLLLNDLGPSEAFVDADVDATFIVMNGQSNSGPLQSFGATTQYAAATATVQSLEEGEIDLSSNAITAQAGGNASTNEIASTANMTTFAASAAVANSQNNRGTAVAATNDMALVRTYTGLNGGLTVGSDVSVDANAVTSKAMGNETDQDLALSATNLTLSNGVALLSSDVGFPAVFANGSATVANLQSNIESSVTASTTGSSVGVNAASALGLTGNNLATTRTVQDSLAAVNSANNALALDGNTVGGSSGLLNAQVATTSDATASTTDNVASVVSLFDFANGSIDLTNNTQQARAVGSSATNSVSVAGTTADLVSSVNPASDPTTASVASNFGLVNTQTAIASDVTATADAGAAGGLRVLVDGNALNANMSNDANSFVGLAFGTQASNAISVDLGTITSDDTLGASQVANALSVQDSSGDVSATATGGSIIDSFVSGSVTGSSITTSGNLIRAQSTGNVAATSTTVDATSIDTTQLADVTGSTALEAAFSVDNRQDSVGNVSASQLDSPTLPTQSAGILTTTGGTLGVLGVGVVNSTVVSANNTSETRATANSSSNMVDISANSAATSSAVRNGQTNNGTVQATMGIAGTAPVAGATYDSIGGDGTTVASVTLAANQVTISGGSLQIGFDTGEPGSSALADLLTGLGASVVGGVATFAGGATYDFSAFDNLTLGFDSETSESTLSFNGFSTLGSPGVDPAGGVTILANGPTVTGSTLAVEGNISRGAVTGNSAANTLLVDATSITGGLGTPGEAGEATHVLSNDQVDNAFLASNVRQTFQVDAAEDAAITGSTIRVSDNTQSATAVSNTAQSMVVLGSASAALIDATSELGSEQDATNSVSATSTMQVSAPAAMAGSTLELDGNRNTALAVGNDAANATSVRAANIDTASATATNATLDGNLSVSQADHLVSSDQSAFGPVSATADSSIFNQDLLDIDTAGLLNSSASLSGNATVAEASLNRATNSLTMAAGSTLSATGGVMNRQFATNAATASATSEVTLALTGAGGLAALDGSSLAIEGNSTSALARGNFASNALNATASGGYAPQAAGAFAAMGLGGNVSATFAVLNSQESMGPVSATSVGATYGGSLSGQTSVGQAIMGGSLNVGGNFVSADAYGNQADNSLVLAGLNTVMPTSAVGNYQMNAGSVTSVVSGASIGLSGSGIVNTSSMGVTGNTVSASATGNSVTNRITGN